MSAWCSINFSPGYLISLDFEEKNGTKITEKLLVMNSQS